MKSLLKTTVLAATLLTAMAAQISAGEEAAKPKRPGLRMDPILVAAAGQFMGADITEGMEVVPGISISGAADGYTIRRYAIMKNKEEQAFFFRVRTLFGTPDRDVAVKFAADGKLEDAFDMLPPPMPEEAPPAEGAEKKPDKPKPEPKKPEMEEGEFVEVMEGDGEIGSLSIVLPLVGRHPLKDAASLAALLKGIARAESLVKAGKEIVLEPLPKDAFLIKNPLPPLGKPMPALSTKTVQGVDISNKSLRRKSVAIFFTALESIACEKINMLVAKWMEDNPAGAKKIVLVLVKRPEEVLAIIKDSPLKDKLVVSDPMNDIGQAFKIETRPMLLIYSKRHVLTQVITPDSLGKLDDALKGVK